MTSVEQRVVEMKFNKEQFAAGVKSTLADLSALKQGLKLEGAKQGLEEVSNTANKFSLDGMKNQVTGMMGHFTALQVAAVTALSNIVNRAVDAGLQLAKSMTLEPLMDGFREYELNLNSIQTIMANTGLKGAEGLNTVTGVLEELNHYSDQTIYNFSEMAKNIGTFTAAGVKLDVAASAIKGIANLAAISGSNAEQASAAMYQMSQALAAGKVTLEDWNSVVNAGMGGKVFQDSLIETARVHGVNVDAIIKKQGSFRLSLEKGWLTSGILTETLSKFTGELSAEQLKSMGYTDEQAQSILEMGQTAVDAATKVKTMTQLMTTLREGLGSGWAKTWQLIFGDFDEARETFTGVSNVLGGIIQRTSDARNELIGSWKELGGRTALLDGIKNAFEALLSVLRPIRDAFNQMFPAATAQQLYEMTVNFRNFMERLKIGDETANNLRRTFAGLFAILGIGWDFLKAGIKFFADLLGRITAGSGGVLRFTGNIGDFLVAVRQALQEGQAFTKFFSVLTSIISGPLDVLSRLGAALGRIFREINFEAADKALTGFANTASPLANMISNSWDRVGSFFSKAGKSISDALKSAWEWLKKLGTALDEATGGLTSKELFGGLNTAAFVAFVTFVYNFFKNFKPGEFLEGITDSIGALTGALRGMQFALSGAALLAIALAIGVLALSMKELAKIDEIGLTRASAALTVMMGQLAAAFVVFNRLGTAAGSAKLIIMATGMLRLAAAIRLLVSSVTALAALDWNQLAKGLTGVLTLMAILVGGTNLLPTKLAGIVKTATGLLVLTIGIRNLVNAVEDFAVMDWEGIAKGLTGIAVLLGSLALFTRFAAVDKMGVGAGIGLVLLAASLKILASAVGDFVKFNWEELGRGMAAIAVGLGLITAAMNFLPEGAVLKAAGFAIIAFSLKMIADGVAQMSQMSWGEIGRGLTVMAGALAAIALAIAFLPPHSLLSAAAVLVVAAALEMIQQALGKMGNMTWEQIAKGLVALAGALLIISGALLITQGAIGGAVAIGIMALALTLLTPVLQALGEMSWGAIVKGLVALAGIFLVLGLAGYALGPLVPAILGLSGAIALLGIAVFAAGIGMLAFATAMGILAVVGAASTAVLLTLVGGLIGLIPLVMEQIGLGLIAFAKVIATAGPVIVDTLVVVLNSLLDAVIEVTPKLVDLLLMLLFELLRVLVEAQPRLVDAGAKLIVGLLRGIADNIGDIVDAATDIIVNFLDGLGRNLPRVVMAGVDLVLNFVNGIADGIRDRGKEIGDAGWNIATALVDGVVEGIKQFAKRAVDAAIQIAKDMINAAKEAMGIASPSKEGIYMGRMLDTGLAVGTKKYSYLAEDAASDVGESVVDSMGGALSNLGRVIDREMKDFTPVVTPVLDLTRVKRSALDLHNILNPPKLPAPEPMIARTRIISSTFNEHKEADDTPKRVGGDTFNYVQNNNSPKTLSSAEIYRQTNNLISKRRGPVGANSS